MQVQHLYRIEASKGDEETPIYRNRMCVEINFGKLVRYPKDGSTTFYQLIKNTIESKQDKNSLGYREVVGEVEEKKLVEKKVDGKIVKVEKIWKFYKLSDYKWLSYNQIGSILVDLSNGLYELGLRPKDKVTFYAPTSHNWILLAYASFYKNLTVATVYDTLGAEGLQYGLIQTKSTALFLATEQLDVLENVYSNCATLTCVIYIGKLEKKQLEKFKDIKFISFDELIGLGRVHTTDPIPPNPDDVAVIMYTSGSTGTPKGVQLSHGMLACQISGLELMINPWLTDNETMVVFLPLAHILSFMATSFGFYSGMEVGFASPRTLLSSSVRECSGDLVALKPTIMPAVPQVFDSIRKAILNKVYDSGTFKSNMFNLGLLLKSKFKSYDVVDKMLNKLIFDKLKQLTGGRLKLGLCGGAPLSEDVRKFFDNALCTITQAYGMTELCGLASVMLPHALRPCCIGIPSPSFDIKLVDFAEGGYFAKDNVGELWIRGPSVTKGYFNDPKSTDESFTDDGWLKTGDIVRMDDEGQLYIIDRKKNLVKLCNGEYIALEKLESIYKNSIYVHNVCLFANSNHSNPVAVVQANLEALSRFSTQNGLSPIQSYQDLVGRDDLNVQVLKSCIKEAIKAKLNSFEMISQVYLTKVEWTVINNMLNPAMKVNRKLLQDKFKDQLQFMYNSQ